MHTTMTSFPELSDTKAASSGTRFVQTSGPADPWQPPALPSLPSPRFGRSKSLANPAVVVCKPIRRKPLSATASAMATRFSSQTGQGIAADSARPEQRYSRALSMDSPTLYEFPDSLDAVVNPVAAVTSSSSFPAAAASPLTPR